jgi:primase-polymerase (primpol)-like protein
MITETTPAIIAENIPEELRELDQWVNWRFEERDDKLTKVPYNAHTGQRASSTDLKSWTTFEHAHTEYACSGGIYDGIGFVFSDDDPYCGIDLDKCRYSKTGEIDQWAVEIVDRVGEGYVEISPSGTGIHIIIRASVRGGGMRKGPVEMYSRGRYFTITGRTL